MRTTRPGVCDREPCEGVVVRTASEHPLLGLGTEKAHPAFLYETLDRLILREIWHVPQLKERMLYLRETDGDDLEFAEKNPVLVIVDSIFRLSLKGKLVRMLNCHLPNILELPRVAWERL